MSRILTEATALPAARVRHSATQSITTATVTTLAFNTEDYDTDGLHDTVTDNSRLTVLNAGLYAIEARVAWAANTTGRRHIGLQLNGAAVFARDIRQAVSEVGPTTEQGVSTHYALAAGDYVEVQVRQDSGGALVVQSNGVRDPVFAMHFLGAAP